MKITLIAINNQGASIEFKGETKKEALRKFKNQYTTKGWKVTYLDDYGRELGRPLYKAYIASNRYTKAFDTAYGDTAASAIATVKRKNSPDWRDCITWAERTDLPY